MSPPDFIEKESSDCSVYCGSDLLSCFAAKLEVNMASKVYAGGLFKVKLFY